VLAAFRELGAAIDAAADAVTAENVFQFAAGNLTRGTGSLDEVAGGNAPPPTLQFLRTPRTGTTLSHRVVVAVEAGLRADPAAGWAGPAQSPRAAAEPALEAWCGQLLGPATDVEVVVEVASDPVARHTIPLAALGFAALDLVATSGDAGSVAELARRAARAATGAAPNVAVRLDLSPAADRGRRNLADLLELAGQIRSLFAGARPLTADDLRPAHASSDASTDAGLDALAARVDAAVAALGAARQGVAVALGVAAGPVGTVGAMRAALDSAGRFGVAGSSQAVAGADDEPLPSSSVARALAARVLAELDRRLAAAGATLRALAADPGFSHTDLQANSARQHRGLSQRFFDTAVGCVGTTPARGALPQLRAATDPSVRGGELYGLRFVIGGSPIRNPYLSRSMTPLDLATLWSLSERETDTGFDVEGMVRAAAHGARPTEALAS